jgi:hypothetical protein
MLTKCTRKCFFIAAIFIFYLNSSSHLIALDSASDLGSLRVLTVHRLSNAEQKAQPLDYIGANKRIRLRFEAPKRNSVYLYAPSECPPEGYVLERKDGKIIWLASLRKEDPSMSPGFADLKSQLGDGWIFLPASAAIEWDVDTEPTPDGIQRARSVFVIKKKGQPGTEVLSNWFEISPSAEKTPASLTTH